MTAEGSVLGRKKGKSKSPEVRRLKGHRQDQVGVGGGNKPQAEFYSDLEKVRTRTGSGQKSGISALSFGDRVKNWLQGVRREQEDPAAGLPRRGDAGVGVGHTQPCWDQHLEAQLVMGSLFTVSNGNDGRFLTQRREVRTFPVQAY